MYCKKETYFADNEEEKVDKSSFRRLFLTIKLCADNGDASLLSLADSGAFLYELCR